METSFNSCSLTLVKDNKHGMPSFCFKNEWQTWAGLVYAFHVRSKILNYKPGKYYLDLQFYFIIIRNFEFSRNETYGIIVRNINCIISQHYLKWSQQELILTVRNMNPCNITLLQYIHASTHTCTFIMRHSAGF